MLDGLRAFSAASDLLDSAVADHLDLNRTDLRCLDHLGRAGPVPAGRLAEAVGLTTGALTTAVDRLERAGYVERRRDPADRRRVLVALTPAAAPVSALFSGVAPALRRVAEPLSEQELRRLAAFVQAAAAVFADQAARLRARA